MNINWTIVIKVVTGIFVVPIAILANTLWPWWQGTNLFLKIVTAPIVLPITGLAYATGFWWNNL